MPAARLADLAAGRRPPGLDALTTDRSDASGTGYWSPATGQYRPDLLELALGHAPAVPSVLAPARDRRPPHVRRRGSARHRRQRRRRAGPGCPAQGDVIVSIGTSGTVFSVAATPAADATGTVAGFADATGRFLPLVATLNAARVLDAASTPARRDHDELAELALSAPAGADGLVLVPYFEGERTPNRPHATGALHGLRLANTTPAHLARAAVEGLLCALADGLDALVASGADGRTGHPDRRRGPVAGGTADRPGDLRAARPGAAARGVRRRRRRPAGRLGGARRTGASTVDT